MSKINPTSTNRFTSIFCNLFGHHYVVAKRVTEHIKEYRCLHCAKKVTTDVSGKLSPLTPQLRDINSTLEKMYQKRNRRRQVHKVA